MDKPIIVSACLAGLECRFDCKAKPNEKIIELVRQGKAIPVCPEQLGGLPTPRLPAERIGDKILQNDGKDVTENLVKGSNQALYLAKITGANKAILKSKSPTCGKGKIFDGTFSGKLVDGDGVFAKACIDNGIEVLTEEEI